MSRFFGNITITMGKYQTDEDKFKQFLLTKNAIPLQQF